MPRMKNIQPIAASTDAPDAELVRRVAGGETAAFETLMRRHNRTLFRTARAILRDDAEAEDTLQEAYLQAYAAIGSFRGEARVSTWFARIVANEALMRLRKHARRAQIVPLQSDSGAEELKEIPDMNIDQTPERSAQRAQMRRLLEAQIDALPDDYRVVFVLARSRRCWSRRRRRAADSPGHGAQPLFPRPQPPARRPRREDRPRVRRCLRVRRRALRPHRRQRNAAHRMSVLLKAVHLEDPIVRGD
jgi:RNA polymerase sigma-70 factor (ECF subfamily)